MRGRGESTSAGTEALDRAVAAFRAGEPVLVHDADDREGETDLLYPASAVTPAAVSRLRNDGGGLVFVALTAVVADRFALPFLHEELDHPANDHTDLDYDTRPSFSLTVNHRDSFTGVTDDDRARTIRRLGEASDDDGYDVEAFAEEFRTPGHVHLLRAAPGLLTERLGHTELGLALAREAGVAPAVAGCEMLDDETGEALSTADALAYARRHDLPFVEGAALVDELT
ncbi:3,4-dihydroxy-2-butanone-4-phosphate synthase [Haloplanus pelagicus]|jgi:3,4-dihydroxy 2-butanone 4-phosphate synthase|uniref:3,4-dihydroxy-2-butanone-4-phosphate synthase n=1 Tax=Haloplanus pelagicus TaxID=2949995 RepID=UPI00203C9FD2|nr:3,4-dihydroxy-2-butanone-4-phosphate synthase [Haloplanus sp. HW8-1]